VEPSTSSLDQSGAGQNSLKRKQYLANDDFVTKVALLVTEKIKPRLPGNIWNNFSLSLPNSTCIETANTEPPIHYENLRVKTDENDVYDEKRLLSLTPPKFRKNGKILINKLNERSLELTWNSSGTVFVDEIAVPNSNMFILFPYLFKAKRPKDLNGFQELYNKIIEMGLQKFIYKKPDTYQVEKKQVKVQQDLSDNWWFLD
jgi:hypothetical protein